MKKISLRGKWTLSEKDHKNLSVEFPGDIHSALVKQKIIPDPYYEKNELQIQWVGKTCWTCARQVEVDADFLEGRQFILLCGADTFVRVFVNGREAGFCENFFRKWRFEITDFLREGKNEIALVFESAEKRAIAAAKKLPYPVPCSQYDVCSPHRNLNRKSQCHSGWDWGPCIMAAGVYEEISLLQSERCFVDALQTETKKNPDASWTLFCKACIFALEDCEEDVSFCVEGEGVLESGFGKKTQTLFSQKLHAGENFVEAKIKVKNPEVWNAAFCNRLDEEKIAAGESPAFKENALYEVKAVCAGAEKIVRTAFRELRVIAKKDKHGRSLYIEVNGRAVFAKGANWIPCDALPSRQTPQKYEHLLDSVVKANMNALRVWGGGIYEREVFYELCDKKGILVWQDMMFACSMYPANEEFLENVRIEIREQIRRLSHHPCIALWCGNNENLGAMKWYEESRENPQRYIVDYDRLNEGVVGSEVKKNDASRIWWPSSPSAGPADFSDNWHSDGRGDMHFWSVWHEKKPFEEYQKIAPRFVSEFGYQSLPSISQIAAFAKKSDFNLSSPVMEFHQRSPNGNAMILENFARYFRVPKSFEEQCYLSQVQQALAIKTAASFWRSLMPVCMGALFWQLNDVWPVVSWSSIEYSGRWKLLQYEAKKFFAPLALILFKKEKTIFAYVLNETKIPFCGTAKIFLKRFDGSDAKKIEIPVNAKSESSKKIWECSESELGAEKNEVFVFGELFSKSEKQIMSDAIFCDAPKKCALLPAKISVKISQNEDGDFEIALASEKPAFYVALFARDAQGLFSDNMFCLLPKKPKKIFFRQKNFFGNAFSKKISLKEFSKALSVFALNDLH